MADILHLTVRSELDELGRRIDEVRDFLESRGTSPRAVYAAALAVEEMGSNVIRHGYRDRGRHELDITVEAAPGQVLVIIEDDAPEFDPMALPPRDPPSTLEEAPIGGLGVEMVRRMAGSMVHERRGDKNHLEIRIPN